MFSLETLDEPAVRPCEYVNNWAFKHLSKIYKIIRCTRSVGACLGDEPSFQPKEQMNFWVVLN